ncbi:MAG: hypothetical protein ACR2IQ_01095 [Minisyncoccia bacterium]
MVYVVFKTEDRKKLLEKHNNFVASFVDHNEPSFNLNQYIDSVSLFDQKNLYQFVNFISDGGIDMLVKDAKPMVSSPNVFIFQETDITEPRRKKLEAVGFNVGKNTNVTKKFSNEIFALSDAIYARDKKNAWVTFQTLVKKFATEEIHGTILWAIKMMRVHMYASDLDIKPFVASNASLANKKYTSTEIDTMHRQLVRMYHDAHNGKIDFNITLEKWLLCL